LLLLIPVSFLFPFINIVFSSIPQAITDVPLFESVNLSRVDNLGTYQTTIADQTISYWSILTYIYCIGVSLALAKLLVSIRKLRLFKQNSKSIQQDGYWIVFANTPEIFSFFRWIFIPEMQKDSYDKVVVEHELAHINLYHSLDIILTEVFIGFLWFNPLAYDYRKSIRSIHEFQADKSVLDKEVKVSHYLQVLLQNLEIKKPNTIYNYFNYPILKRRIEMITRTKSTPISKLQYLFLLPAFLLFLFAFAKPNAENSSTKITAELFNINTPPPSLFPVKNKSIEDITSFFGAERKFLKKGQGKIHGGIDIGAKTGTPIVATADGTILKAAMEGNWGNLIVISHSDGYETWYAHLDNFSVKENQLVKKGEVIGVVGNTGGLSTGPHLHYEVKHDGKRVNPLDYFSE
jgi:murein DD-endopeptidase MepM/ murein hydrolase activator NlpD